MCLLVGGTFAIGMNFRRFLLLLIRSLTRDRFHALLAACLPKHTGKVESFRDAESSECECVRSHTIIIVGLIGPLLVSTLLLHDGAVNKNHCHLVKLSVVDLFLLRSGHVT